MLYGVIQLAGDVVLSADLAAWDAAGRPATHELPTGAWVAIGPADANGADIAQGCAELERLVTDGGPIVAGAGIDLGGGFRSARLAGARGDRRDAVLAALRLLPPDQVHRLGHRAAILVALFGPDATKPLGAAASRAIDEERWPALTLASAASDVLGTEQLEAVLAWEAPDGVDPLPHAQASTLANHLALNFDGITKPRRLTLLRDLWGAVVERLVDQLCRSRRRDGQLIDQASLFKRRQRMLDDIALKYAWWDDASPANLAQWIPPGGFWDEVLTASVDDALAATVLGRLAVTSADSSLHEALYRHAELLEYGAKLISRRATNEAKRKVSGLDDRPARAGAVVRDIYGRLASAPLDERTTVFIQERLAMAHDYANVVLETLQPTLSTLFDLRPDLALGPMSRWTSRDLKAWRAVAGYSDVRPPESWTFDMLAPPGHQGRLPSLSSRLGADPAAAPGQLETVGDMLWYADLADIHAQLHGYDQAAMTEYFFGQGGRAPHMHLDRTENPPAPFATSLDSVATALTETAQLRALGGRPSGPPRTWSTYADGLSRSVATAAAGGAGFPVPDGVSAYDGRQLPGTEARLEIARDSQTLLGWSTYMGNCISGEYYADAASTGRTVLAALRNADGAIVANLHFAVHRSGWRLMEIQGRFNNDPDPELERHVLEWIKSLPGREPVPPPEPHRAQHDADGPRRRRSRLLPEVAEPLSTLAADEYEAAQAAATRLAALAITLDGRDLPSSPKAVTAGLFAVRRARAAGMQAAVRVQVGDEQRQLTDLWDAAGVRPVARALDRLDPDLMARYPRLCLLTQDTPLPSSAMRELARRPGVGAARTMELAAIRTRAAISALARADDPVLAAAIYAAPCRRLLCALALVTTATASSGLSYVAVTSPGEVDVPGFPESSLTEVRDGVGVWADAWVCAAELGAIADDLWAGIDKNGLLVPASWLGGHGWGALWTRASR